MLLAALMPAISRPDISWHIGLDLANKYIWRGQDLTDRPVLQGVVELSAGRLTCGLWANMELTNVNDRSADISELDYYVAISDKLAHITAAQYSAGLIVYDFHGRSSDGGRTPDTIEAFFGLTLDLPLSPSMKAYLDQAQGIYICLSLAERLSIGLDLQANLGWATSNYNKYYWLLSENLFNDLQLKASYPINMGQWTLSPCISYVTLASSSIRSADVYNSDSSQFIVMFSIHRDL